MQGRGVTSATCCNEMTEIMDDMSPRYRLRIIAAATMTVALVGFSITLVFPYLALKLAAEGYSRLYIGVATGIGGIANILVAPLVPSLAKRFGVQSVIVAALLTAALCLLLFDPFPYPAIDLTLRFLTGAAIGSLFIMGEFWINAAAPDRHRGLILGIYGSFLAIGFAAGPMVLDLVGTDTPTALHVGAGVFIAALLPVVLMTKGAPDLEGGSGANITSFLLSAPIATIAGLLFGMIEPSALNLLPVYGLGIGLPLTEATALVSAMALGNMLQIPLGLLADRIDRRVMLLACGLGGAVLALGLPALSATPWALLIGIFFWSGIASGFYTIGLTLLGARFRGADLAHANATFVILYSVGLLIGPPIVGAAMDALPPHGFFWSLSVIFIGYAALVASRLALGRSG
ncbi:MAG: MFS transporter [Alphaproteobacteria bacterium]|nr:MFS transporter [Alphaproteobacteria bacterium]